MSTSVVFNDVTKKYKMYKKTSDKIFDLVLPSGYGKAFYALQNVSFEAEKGDVIGIIGVNGAGKSTLSNLISGIIPPSAGSIKVNGEAALISIAAGLNNELSGRENIELKCLMLGFKKEDIHLLMPEIIDFADIGEFIDQPVKKYSSGMKSRLGFAISVSIDPDILVIDEALSVGDKTFYQKCIDRMNSFKEKGKTIFFISHSIGQVKEFCQKALWLEAGEIKAYGPVEEVIPQYEKFIKEFNKMSKEQKREFNNKINEKRSSYQAVTEHTTRGELSRRKPKRKGFLVATSLIVLALIIGGALLFLKWNHVINYFQADKKAHAVKVEEKKKEKVKGKPVDAKKVEEPPTEAVKDVRYVNMVTGFVRDMPDLAASKKVTMVNFGDPITVEQIEKDPVEDFNWLKFTLANGREGWISDKLVTKVETPLPDGNLLPSLRNLVSSDEVDEMIAMLGKGKEELGTTRQKAGETLSFDSNNKVLEVNKKTADALTKAQIIEQLGEPALNQGTKRYFFHGEKYDVIFYSLNGSTFSSMTLRAVSSDK